MMAIQTILDNISLKIVQDAGIIDGKQVVKRISFPVKFEATDANIHLTALALNSLTNYSVIQVLKDEVSVLRDED